MANRAMEFVKRAAARFQPLPILVSKPAWPPLSDTAIKALAVHMIRAKDGASRDQ